MEQDLGIGIAEVRLREGRIDFVAGGRRTGV
jgi:hypothetical protein